MLSAYESKQLSKACPYFRPSNQKDCETSAGQISGSLAPSATNPALGYIAINGNRALVGTTGKFCAPDHNGCFTNSDPAALLSAGHTFSALWNTNSTPTAYSLTLCVKINGKWYIAN